MMPLLWMFSQLDSACAVLYRLTKHKCVRIIKPIRYTKHKLCSDNDLSNLMDESHTTLWLLMPWCHFGTRVSAVTMFLSARQRVNMQCVMTCVGRYELCAIEYRVQVRDRSAFWINQERWHYQGYLDRNPIIVWHWLWRIGSTLICSLLQWQFGVIWNLLGYIDISNFFAMAGWFELEF